ncbi:MAG: GntR family transcriptional regulator [Planctomycetota bacterium]|jgi:DNA-binding GntR family transcriptional regulator|nr:GntR family transcriptional regulator [Planctomycetota bacterium]
MTPVKIQAQRVPDLVMEQLMAWIMDGRLHMGQKLVAEELAQAFGVSRMPIREALKNLEKLGIVESIPYVGARLVTLSKTDIKQIYMMRKALEPVLGHHACLNAAEEDIAEIACNQDEFESVMRNGKPTAQEVFVQNRKFHFSIYRASKMNKILETVSMLWDNLAFCKLIYGQTYVASDEAAEDMMRVHRGYVEALVARDAGLMFELMRTSLGKSEVEVPEKLAEYIEG